MGNGEDLTGEQIKNLLVSGELPTEYLSEKNLSLLMAYELEIMGDNENYDTSVIIYCSDMLGKIIPKSSDYEQRKNQIYANIMKNTKQRERQKRMLNVLIKRISVACLIALVSVQIVSVTAFNQNFFASVYNWSKDMFVSLIGKETSQNDTDVNFYNSIIYGTIEDLEQAENIDILAPNWFSLGIKIKSVSYLANKEIYVLYDDDVSNLIVAIGKDTIEFDESVQIYKVNGLDFYIFEESKIISWVYQGNYYNLNFKFKDLEEAKKIINNIK